MNINDISIAEIDEHILAIATGQIANEYHDRQERIDSCHAIFLIRGGDIAETEKAGLDAEKIIGQASEISRRYAELNANFSLIKSDQFDFHVARGDLNAAAKIVESMGALHVDRVELSAFWAGRAMQDRFKIAIPDFDARMKALIAIGEIPEAKPLIKLIEGFFSGIESAEEAAAN